MATEYSIFPEEKRIEIIVDGKITQQDFDRVADEMEELIDNYGKIKLLEEIREFDGFDPSVLWEGILFDIEHMKDFSHCAVLTDSGWIGPFSKAAGAFLPCKVRVFSLDQIDEARAWLNSE